MPPTTKSPLPTGYPVNQIFAKWKGIQLERVATSHWVSLQPEKPTSGLYFYTGIATSHWVSLQPEQLGELIGRVREKVIATSHWVSLQLVILPANRRRHYRHFPLGISPTSCPHPDFREPESNRHFPLGISPTNIYVRKYKKEGDRHFPLGISPTTLAVSNLGKRNCIATSHWVSLQRRAPSGPSRPGGIATSHWVSLQLFLFLLILASLIGSPLPIGYLSNKKRVREEEVGKQNRHFPLGISPTGKFALYGSSPEKNRHFPWGISPT